MKSYTATAKGSHAESPAITSPESHATIQGLRRELEELSLRLEKGEQVIAALREAGDERFDDAVERYWALNRQWSDRYQFYDELLGDSPHNCVECNPGMTDFKPTDRLCGQHARKLMAMRAKLSQPDGWSARLAAEHRQAADERERKRTHGAEDARDWWDREIARQAAVGVHALCDVRQAEC